MRDVLKARRKGHPDDRAYEELVRRHQAWLLRLLTSLLHNQADAEDVGQEVFVRAFLALDTFRGDASFRSWLRTIATRTAFNWKRGRKTASHYEHAASEQRAVLDSRSAAPPSGAIVAREVLTSLLEASPYPYKEILVLRYLEELSLKEIATTLDISLSAAKMRLKRARDDFETRHAQLE